jgi:hypothetical protein
MKDLCGLAPTLLLNSAAVRPKIISDFLDSIARLML